MESATTRLLQSKYYTPVFNTAIFDGPMRFYFAQQHEDDALKIYFQIQEQVNKLQEGLKRARDERLQSPTLFVMLYPNDDSYKDSFESVDNYESRKLGDDFILGVRGPKSSENVEGLVEKVNEIIKQWIS